MIRSAIIMAVAMLSIPLGDAAGKLLGSSYSVEPIFIAWSRFLLGTIFILLLLVGNKINFKLMLDWRIWLRGSLVTGCIYSILTALSTEPISNVFAAFFIGPIVSYFGSALFLGEEISFKRTIFLFIGFCGVLLVVKPGVNISAGMGFAMLAGVFYGGFLITSKWLAHLADSKTLLLSQLLVGSIFLLPGGLQSIPSFNLDIALLVFLSAAASALGNLLLIMANQREDASKLAPLVYIQLIAATIYGALIFNTIPDGISLIGLSLLLVSGFASFISINRKKINPLG